MTCCVQQSKFITCSSIHIVTCHTVVKHSRATRATLHKIYVYQKVYTSLTRTPRSLCCESPTEAYFFILHLHFLLPLTYLMSLSLADCQVHVLGILALTCCRNLSWSGRHLVLAAFHKPSSVLLRFIIPRQNLKMSSRFYASFFVVGSEKCSNLSLTVQKMCWQALDYRLKTEMNS